MEIFIHDLALGQLIQFLSLMLHVNEQTVVITSDKWCEKKIIDVKSICNIPDNRLVVRRVLDFTQPSEIGNDRCKPLSPYFKPLDLNLFGTSFSIDRKGRKKPCVGITIAKSEWELIQLINDGADSHTIDNRRSYDYDVFEKIIKLALATGYDVITLNTYALGMEQKTYLISQLCDCVIGYEGGVMHLAHCFDTPCIILPWKNELVNGSHEIQTTMAEKTHLDKSTYFLSGPDEILAWTSDDFLNVLERLKKRQGNNKLLTQEYANGIPDIDEFLSCMGTNIITQEFIKDHLIVYTVGGYDNLELFTTV
jgi:hypothetical protein